MVVPPLSLRGVYNSLRVPTLADWKFSIKAYVAAAFALLAGFSQNLENPYWAVVTIYIVLSPPESGAIRSKALFRFIGTIGGGTVVMAVTGVFGDQVGILAVVTLCLVTVTTYLRQIIRTPANYMWFSSGVTAGVVGLTNLLQPVNMFDYATARMGEISLGILAITAADSLLWPRPMTPDFLATLVKWRGQARDQAADALELMSAAAVGEARLQEIRQGLRDLAKLVGVIDAKGVQLPFDIVRAAPRLRQLNLVRRLVVGLLADLTLMLFWARALRGDLLLTAHIGEALEDFRRWLGEEPDQPSRMTQDRTAKAEALAAALEALYARLDPATDRNALSERGLLVSMAVFLRRWSHLSTVIHAIADGAPLPPALDALARRARPVRSTDYLGAAFDVAPLVLSMTVTLLIWYLTAWNAGAGALLFSFIGCVFLVGQDRILSAGVGLICWVFISFGTVFVYQYAVLPRVTDFPVLIAVLGCALLPFGLLMTMSMAGMLICVYTFAFLGLQSTYAADFESSLQTLFASLTGLLIAVASLHTCSYSHARFATRRLIAAVRRDVFDLARAPRTPERQRFLFLAVDRLALYFPAAEVLAGDGPIPRLRMLDDFAVGFNLLTLREQEPSVSAPVRARLAALREAAAGAYRRKLSGKADGGAFLAGVDAALDDPVIWAEPAADRLLHALTGLHLALLDPGSEPAAEAAAG